MRLWQVLDLHPDFGAGCDFEAIEVLIWGQQSAGGGGGLHGCCMGERWGAVCPPGARWRGQSADPSAAMRSEKACK